MNKMTKAFLAEWQESIRIIEDTERYQRRESIYAAAAEYMVKRGWKSQLVIQETTHAEIQSVELEKVKVDKNIQLLESENELNKVKEKLAEKKPIRFIPETVIEAVCEYYAISEDDLKKKGRKNFIARNLVVYFLTNIFKFGLTKIGTYINRNHSTIGYTLDNFDVETLDQWDRMAFHAIKIELEKRKEKMEKYLEKTP